MKISPGDFIKLSPTATAAGFGALTADGRAAPMQGAQTTVPSPSGVGLAPRGAALSTTSASRAAKAS